MPMPPPFLRPTVAPVSNTPSLMSVAMCIPGGGVDAEERAPMNHFLSHDASRKPSCLLPSTGRMVGLFAFFPVNEYLLRSRRLSITFSSRDWCGSDGRRSRPTHNYQSHTLSHKFPPSNRRGSQIEDLRFRRVVKEMIPIDPIQRLAAWSEAGGVKLQRARGGCLGAKSR